MEHLTSTRHIRGKLSKGNIYKYERSTSPGLSLVAELAVAGRAGLRAGRAGRPPGASTYRGPKMRFKNMPTLIHDVDTPYRKATFGMGCFWASDALFGAKLGVLRTRVGYSGGTTNNPVYRQLGDHTEVIEIDYDPKAVSFEELLELFWNNHEYGLTGKIKRQYTSLILYHDEDQKRIAEISLKKEKYKRKEELITEIAPAGPFYPAEDYHQKYRLQQHNWLCEALGLTSERLQTSHVAARLNGYLVGVGAEENLTKDVVTLGLPEKITEYVKEHYQENKGGSLYC